jgi:hypothetical protein
MTLPERFATRVPSSLLGESGKVFYAGRQAFAEPSPLYVLGVNPGGDPDSHCDETVGSHTSKVLDELPADWSAYRDESWLGAAPGTWGMAPRILHLFRQLDLSPGRVPASNLIFVRSRREALIKERKNELASLCWPFHEQVINELQPRVVLCLGATAGSFVRRQLRATQLVGQFIERNNRRWRSQVFAGSSGLKVVVATHPSIADWCAAATDPSALVEEALR